MALTLLMLHIVHGHHAVEQYYKSMIGQTKVTIIYFNLVGHEIKFLWKATG